MAKSKTIKTPEQVQGEMAKTLAFNTAKTTVLDKVLAMRTELGDDTFDGTDEAIAKIPSGKADQSVDMLNQLVTIAQQVAAAVGINFKENLAAYVASYAKAKERENKREEPEA